MADDIPFIFVVRKMNGGRGAMFNGGGWGIERALVDLVHWHGYQLVHSHRYCTVTVIN
jgi:hypothetical protein